MVVIFNKPSVVVFRFDSFDGYKVFANLQSGEKIMFVSKYSVIVPTQSSGDVTANGKYGSTWKPFSMAISYLSMDERITKVPKWFCGIQKFKDKYKGSIVK